MISFFIYCGHSHCNIFLKQVLRRTHSSLLPFVNICIYLMASLHEYCLDIDAIKLKGYAFNFMYKRIPQIYRSDLSTVLYLLAKNYLPKDDIAFDYGSQHLQMLTLQNCILKQQSNTLSDVIQLAVCVGTSSS